MGPGEYSVEAVPGEGFGFNVNKLHRTFNDKLNGELPKDDQRRKAFEASDSFSNSFPIFIDPAVLFDSHEFTTAMQRKLGCAVTSWRHSFVGHPIVTN